MTAGGYCIYFSYNTGNLEWEISCTEYDVSQVSMNATYTFQMSFPSRQDVKYDTVEIPPAIKEKHSELTLCMDLMDVNGMLMFTSIDKSIRYRSVVQWRTALVPSCSKH